MSWTQTSLKLSANLACREKGNVFETILNVSGTIPHHLFITWSRGQVKFIVVDNMDFFVLMRTILIDPNKISIHPVKRSIKLYEAWSEAEKN